MEVVHTSSIVIKIFYNLLKLCFLDVQQSVQLPVLVGSGVTEENVAQYMNANGIIIGSHLKLQGQWYNDLDYIRVDHFMKKVQKLRHRLSEETTSTAEDEEFKPMLAQGE